MNYFCTYLIIHCSFYVLVSEYCNNIYHCFTHHLHNPSCWVFRFFFTNFVTRIVFFFDSFLNQRKNFGNSYLEVVYLLNEYQICLNITINVLDSHSPCIIGRDFEFDVEQIIVHVVVLNVFLLIFFKCNSINF